MTTILRSALSAIAAFALTVFAMSAPAAAQAPAKVTIVVFGFPSLGAFMPPVIKAQKLDTAHGLDIEFVERPPDAYTTQFNSGEFKVGGSAAVLTVGLADVRGVMVLLVGIAAVLAALRQRAGTASEDAKGEGT